MDYQWIICGKIQPAKIFLWKMQNLENDSVYRVVVQWNIAKVLHVDSKHSDHQRLQENK